MNAVNPVKQETCAFLSVSFGYHPGLLRVWQQQGFYLVRKGNKKNAYSGAVTAMVLKPVSPQGKAFVVRAVAAFNQTFALKASLEPGYNPLPHTD